MASLLPVTSCLCIHRPILLLGCLTSSDTMPRPLKQNAPQTALLCDMLRMTFQRPSLGCYHASLLLYCYRSKSCTRDSTQNSGTNFLPWGWKSVPEFQRRLIVDPQSLQGVEIIVESQLLQGGGILIVSLCLR